MLWLMLLILGFQEGEKKEEAPQADAFKEAQLAWRATHEETMKADDSWLNLVGLFFLKEGANTFGSGRDVRIQLPVHASVEHAGTFYLENGKVRYEMKRAQRAVINGELKPSGPLEQGQTLVHNHLRMFVIERDNKIALRVRDLRARNFLDFKALDFYRPKNKYVIEGTWLPYDPPKTLTVTTVISTEIDLLVPGIIEFKLNGKTLELTPTLESSEDQKYLIMFQDKTSGTTTYSGGRFLYIDPPVDGKVTLDFNKAVNPPCAYTLYATCPLPPADNWLDTGIEAGERTYLKDDEL